MIPMKYDAMSFVPQFQLELNRLLDQWRDSDSSGATADWTPTVDIHELNDRFELYVDLPGVDPKDVEITLQDSVLTLTGERRGMKNVDDEDIVRRRVERGQGRFHRRFILPNTVDAENVKARDTHGVLEITIPKQAKALPRRIKVAA
ncbi:MAG: Hsp20/alpha crystallin family protein [Gammaproteobacteria bacterium]|nr:Hsp20/alpha crystallin family protein [Gammaproteobacteria bacterium]